MERLISDEERIRRAEDVIERRRNADVRISGENFSKDRSMDKTRKMLIQIIICLLLYCGVYYIRNSQDNTSKNIMTNINNFLQMDVDFKSVYSSIVQKCNSLINNNQVNSEESINNVEENTDDEILVQNENNSENLENNEISENNEDTTLMGIGGSSENSDEPVEQDELVSDAEYIKNNFSIINPLPSGVITSHFGTRASSEIVSANHKGIDLGASTGTEIISCMDGEVIEASSEGDFGIHLKVSNNDIIVIYAHCSELLVKKGDKVTQGDKIAKVGSTGKATGPHLHFEIRRDDRAVNPEDILQL